MQCCSGKKKPREQKNGHSVAHIHSVFGNEIHTKKMKKILLYVKIEMHKSLAQSYVHT